MRVDEVLRYSEHYIFASNDGPTLLEQGDAYVEINALINIQTLSPNVPTIALAVYAYPEDNKNSALTGHYVMFR